jgi:hypothetical protein
MRDGKERFLFPAVVRLAEKQPICCVFKMLFEIDTRTMLSKYSPTAEMLYLPSPQCFIFLPTQQMEDPTT